jgi:hypothetical protein
MESRTVVHTLTWSEGQATLRSGSCARDRALNSDTKGPEYVAQILVEALKTFVLAFTRPP